MFKANDRVGGYNKRALAVSTMQQQKNLSPLNLSRLVGVSYQTAKKYLKEMVEDGLVEVYRTQYRPNVVAKIYQWIEVE